MAPERRPQGSAISQAIDEVAQIIEALKRALDQMEDVLELAELAERQKTGDEQEIESLRRALRQLQRPGGPRRHDDEGRQA
jgi:predicted RNase H-like nuclease (RuvC/YqgF family)